MEFQNSVVIKNIMERIRNYVEKSLPGACHILDLHCRQHGYGDCVSLLIEEPSLFKEVLIRVYGFQPGIELIARIYLTPLVLELNLDKTINDLVKILIDNPDELKKIIVSLLKK